MYSAIQRELNSIISSVANTQGLPVSWPNEPFGETGSTYLRVDHLPAETDTPFYGATGDYRGIYQVSIVARKQRGSSKLLSDLTDALLTAFARDTRTTSLVIEKSYASTAITTDSTIEVPVSIRYRGFA